MPRAKKPRPENQWETVNKTITPYDLLNRGNPNTSEPHNRAEDISVKQDNNKEIVIDLIDVNNAVIGYINTVIRPTVIENSQTIPVPVEYAYGERWDMAQKDGFLQDKKGVVLLPLILIKRDNIERNRTLSNKLDGNRVHNYQTFSTQFNYKNQYDNFSVVTNRIPVKDWFSVPVPDYVIITYNCMIFSKKQKSMDEIIQAFNYVGDSYWGDKNRYKFKVNIASYRNSVEYTQGTDRITRSDFDMVINAYLLPDTPQRQSSFQKKILSKAQIVFTLETTDSSEIFSPNLNPPTSNVPTVIINTPPAIPSGVSDPVVLNYVMTNKEQESISHTGNTATFGLGFLTAPDGLPVTSVSNFSFFINGQFVPESAIISFINGGTSSTVTFDTSSLGFGLGGNWNITAIGKFN